MPCNEAPCPPCISVKITQTRTRNILVYAALTTCIAAFGGYGKVAGYRAARGRDLLRATARPIQGVCPCLDHV